MINNRIIVTMALLVVLRHPGCSALAFRDVYSCVLFIAMMGSCRAPFGIQWKILQNIENMAKRDGVCKSILP